VGTKIDDRWFGPRVVVERLGKYSYVVQLDENPKHTKEFHRDHLKEDRTDRLTGDFVPLYYSSPKGKEGALAAGEVEDQWVVTKINDSRKHGPSGQRQFSTEWEGYEDPTWEPMGSFLTAPVGDFLASHPEITYNWQTEWKGDQEVDDS
jgi:hypothetical protein